MPLPPRRTRQQASPSSSLPTSLATQTVHARSSGIGAVAARPGFVVPRKTTKHDLRKAATERDELAHLGQPESAGCAPAKVGPSGLSVAFAAAMEKQQQQQQQQQQDLTEAGSHSDTPQVELSELIDASKRNGVRPPRGVSSPSILPRLLLYLLRFTATIAQSLGFDVIRAEPAPADDPPPSRAREQAAATSSSPAGRSFSLLRSLFSSGRTPDLSRSAGSAGHEEPLTSPLLETTSGMLAAPTTAVLNDTDEATPADWERVAALPDATALPGSEPWVGIEDETDETLLFWDDIDQDCAVGSKDSAIKREPALTYARVVTKG